MLTTDIAQQKQVDRNFIYYEYLSDGTLIVGKSDQNREGVYLTLYDQYADLLDSNLQSSSGFDSYA